MNPWTRRLCFSAVLAAADLAELSAPAGQPPPSCTAIVGVTVIDVAAGVALPGQTVVIVEDRIAGVAPQREVDLPANARCIDGRGLFLMPGLVDAHVHYFERETFGPLFLANGVTLVRDMGMANDLILPLREDLARGALLGPELRTAGAILDGQPPIIPLIALGVATPDEARDAVRRQAAAGVDFIKVYSLLAAETFHAIVDEAHRLGLRVAGHVPDAVPIEEAAAAGLDSSEHFFGFDKLIGRLLGVPVKPAYAGMGADVGCFLRLGEIDPAFLRAAFADLRESGLTVCPTVVTFKVGMQARAFQTGSFPGSEFVSPALLGMWRTLWAAQSDLPAFVWETWARLVFLLCEAGVPLLVGTDLSVPGILPGFSMHDEMEIWQDAGIPAAAVLRSATLIPAQFLGLGDRLGSIAEGKTASMVLLRSNPLDDVRHTRDIDAVICRGRVFGREELDRMLLRVQEMTATKERATE